MPQDPALAGLELKPSPTQCCSATPTSVCAGICAQQIHFMAHLVKTSLFSPAPAPCCGPSALGEKPGSPGTGLHLALAACCFSDLKSFRGLTKLLTLALHTVCKRRTRLKEVPLQQAITKHPLPAAQRQQGRCYLEASLPWEKCFPSAPRRGVSFPARSSVQL